MKCSKCGGEMAEGKGEWIEWACPNCGHTIERTSTRNKETSSSFMSIIGTLVFIFAIALLITFLIVIL